MLTVLPASLPVRASVPGTTPLTVARQAAQYLIKDEKNVKDHCSISHFPQGHPFTNCQQTLLLLWA